MLQWNGHALMKIFDMNIIKRLHLSANLVKSIAYGSMLRGGAGNDGSVVRSDPGEPPRWQTGKLRSDLHTEVNPALYEARIGIVDDNEYGRALELGNPPYLAPRPFLRPALKKAKKRVYAIFAAPIPGLSKVPSV